MFTMYEAMSVSHWHAYVASGDRGRTLTGESVDKSLLSSKLLSYRKKKCWLGYVKSGQSGKRQDALVTSLVFQAE